MASISYTNGQNYSAASSQAVVLDSNVYQGPQNAYEIDAPADNGGNNTRVYFYNASQGYISQPIDFSGIVSVKYDFSDNTEAVVLNGTAQGDVLIGGSGTDSLTGYAGNDILRIQNTPAIVDGGTGADTLSVTGTATLTSNNFENIERVVAYGGANLDMSGVTTAVTGGIPALIRSQSAAGTTATITGTQGADTIAGGAGNDTLNGYLGNDRITTGSGNATIIGGTQNGASDGNDVIFAGSGNLTFQDYMGGLGHDVVRGAAANIMNDTFEFGDSFGRQLSDLHFNQNAAGNTVITGVDGMKGDSITLVGVTSDQAQSAHYLFSAQSA